MGPSRLDLAQALRARDEIEQARKDGANDEELCEMMTSMREEAKQSRPKRPPKPVGLVHRWSEEGRANVRAANLSAEGQARRAGGTAVAESIVDTIQVEL